LSVEAVWVDDALVRIERNGTRARVTMNRPAVRNAFNAELIAALRGAFAALSEDEGVRTIVLAGEGKTFSGGADVAWMRAALDLTEDENVRDAETMAGMLAAIDRCPKPVIARVQGGALGGGCGLIAAADVAVAASDAIFGFSEVKLGLVPGTIAPYVVAKIGVSHARALFVTGERFDAAHARAIGLVHHVVAPDALDARVDALLDELRACGPDAIAAVKGLIRDVVEAPPHDVGISIRAIAKQRTTPEAQEGLRAFLERRPADWHDR
jgi:methylglutaconyl-CoA hydratase